MSRRRKNHCNQASVSFSDAKADVDYFVKNGIMDKRVLQEEPFKTVGSIVELFKEDMDTARINIIDEINRNSEDIVGV
ncbi:hypothetical protein [Anoxybacillus sp. UARK-01]|uniref:hypothetical protein n=1 Tax=Anoxybacillus sp. UARK-01 TaxID=1895648 RepID=UPI001119FB61|nr:hypothetical protein [Anoxybacillus sp. UARK-01]